MFRLIDMIIYQKGNFGKNETGYNEIKGKYLFETIFDINFILLLITSLVQLLC